MKKREKSNNVLKLLIMIFAITILVARVGSVRSGGDGGGSANSPAETSQSVIINSASPTIVADSFTPSLSSTITENREAFLGRTSTYAGSAIGTPDDTIKWKVTVTGPSALTANMIDLDEVGWEDLVDFNIQTFHYPFKQSGNNLVALGSCDKNVEVVGHDNNCDAFIGFSLDENDNFTNADKIKFNSNAPSGLYTIRYELVNTASDPDEVLSNVYQVHVTLDTTGPTIDPVSNEPSNPSCSDNTVEIFATVIDVSSINKVWLNYNVTNEFDIKVKGFRMSLIGDNSYKRDISLPPLNSTRDDGLEVSYEVEANDTLGNLAKSDLQRYVYDCQNPIASFTEIPVNPDEGQEVSFDASGSSDTVTTNNNDLIFEWDFGDGNTGSGKTVTHTYKDNGKYNVTLTVTDKAGNSDETSEIKVVNNVVPTVKDCVITPNPGEEGSEVELTCSFSNPGVLDTHTATINWGDGAIEEGTITEVDGSGTVTASHTYKDNNDYNVVVNVTDKDGGIGTDETTADISNVAPTAHANGPYFGDEGTPVPFTATYNDPGTLDSHTFHWDFGDGSTSDEQNVTHTYVQDGAYPVTLTVTDNDGGVGTDETTATIGNVAPIVKEILLDPNPGDEGMEIALTASFSNPGVNDEHTCTIDWGDGKVTPEEECTLTLDESTNIITGTHVYEDEGDGEYEVTVTVFDEVSSGSDTAKIVINNEAPTANANGPYEGMEGSPIQFTGSFTDSGATDTHTATIDWGDSTTSDCLIAQEDGVIILAENPAIVTDCEGAEANGSGSLSATHTYKKNDIYTVTLTVTDNDGGIGTDETTATILDGTPTASFFQVQEEPKEGDEIQFTDTSTSPADAIVSYEWNFGDDSTSQEKNPTHTYLDDGLYNVSLTVTDEDGSTDTTWELKKVANVAPVVEAEDKGPIDEGTEFSGVVATFTDKGILDTHRATTINWGDGTEDNGVVTESDGSGTVSGKHTYADNNNYKVNVTVWDDSFGDGYDSDTFTFIVNNVAPEVIAIADQVTDKETGIGSVLASFTDAGILDDHTAVIDWGDGTVDEGTVIEEDGSGTVSGHHKYNRSGLFTITITVMDEFDSASDSLNAKVGDFVISLNPGWNLFSVPKVLENNGLATLTSDLNDLILIILTYKDGQWIQPATVEPLKAYWINMEQPGKLLLRFKNASCTDSVCPVPDARQLNAGWELIGYTDTKPLRSTLALKSIEGGYSQWFGFVNGAWISHIFTQFPDINMEPGLGYWIFMTQPKTLAVLSF